MRSLVVHFSGGTEISIETAADPANVFDALTGSTEWLIVEDALGERHYLAVKQIAYLTFVSNKGIGFA
jgi:hypothetical protein